MSIKVGSAHEAHNREFAVQYVMTVLRSAKDWQEGQHALADHPTIGPWIRGTAPDEEMDQLAKAQSIIREAEERLGDALPY